MAQTIITAVLTSIVTSIIVSSFCYKVLGLRYIKILDEYFDTATEQWEKLITNVVNDLRETNGAK